MAKIPSYSDEGIQLNAPVAEGSAWRRSPDLSVDFGMQHRSKFFDNLSSIANSLAIREQGIRNNMEYNDKLNQFMLDAQEKYKDCMNRQGTNALHYDPDEMNPEGQMSVTEDFSKWYSDYFTSMVGGTKNKVVKQKLSEKLNETNLAYMGNLMTHEMKEQDNAVINSNNATATTAMNLAQASLISGDDAGFQRNLGRYDEAMAFSNSIQGKTKEEVALARMTAVDTAIINAYNSMSSDPVKAANMINRYQQFMSASTYEDLRQKSLAGIKTQTLDAALNSLIKAHPEFLNRDRSLNKLKVREYFNTHRNEFTIGTAGGMDVELASKAVAEGESSNNPEAWNEHGRAWGLFQYQEATWNYECENAGLNYTWRNATPEQQKEVFAAEFKRLYKKYDGDVDAIWVAHYGGEGNGDKWHDETVNGGNHSGDYWTQIQYTDGKPYPSFADYVKDKNSKYNFSNRSQQVAVSDKDFESALDRLDTIQNDVASQFKKDVTEGWASIVSNRMQQGGEVNFYEIQNMANQLQAQVGFDDSIKNSLIASASSSFGMSNAAMRKSSSDALDELLLKAAIDPDYVLPATAQLDMYDVTENSDKLRYDAFYKRQQQAKQSGLSTSIDDLFRKGNYSSLISEIVKNRSDSKNDPEQVELQKLKLKDGAIRYCIENNINPATNPDAIYKYLLNQYQPSNISKPGLWNFLTGEKYQVIEVPPEFKEVEK